LGTGVPRLNVSQVRELRIPLPPLNEQRCIVAKLESLQARSRRAREALDAVPPLLEKLRQSILAAAFRGDLTKDWRAKNKNIEPASELLKRIRIERRHKWEQAELAKLKAKGKTPTDDKWKAKYKEPEPVNTEGLPELPEGWCWASLDDLTGTMTSGSRAWSKFYGRGSGTFVMAQNVRPWLPDFSERQRVDPPTDDPERERTLVQDGDLLLTVVGANTGDTCLVSVVPPEHYVCQSVALLRPVSQRLGSHLVAYLNADSGGGGQLKKLAYGQGRPHLSFDQLRTVPVPLVGIHEMDQIQAQLESLLARVEPHHRQLEALHDHVGTLERSVLAQAFRGELVPQDPNDVPAIAAQPNDRATTAAELRSKAPRRKNAKKHS
jgi:type I restriction enzyme, S subunit